MGGGDAEHVKKISKSQFNRQRNSAVLRSNCGNDGYVFNRPSTDGFDSGGQCQIHHVLPVTTLQDGNIKQKGAGKMAFIHNCMAMTKWDINEQPNLIGLPTKKPFYRADKLIADANASLDHLKGLSAAAGNFGALPDLPCHLNAHNEFNDAVINWLNEYLWPELLKDRENCKDKGKDIRGLLEDASKDWKDWLKSRGEEEGGAADCWVNREGEKKSVWYIPHSMALAPQPVDPPPNIYKRTGTVKSWLGEMFGAVSG